MKIRLEPGADALQVPAMLPNLVLERNACSRNTYELTAGILARLQSANVCRTLYTVRLGGDPMPSCPPPCPCWYVCRDIVRGFAGESSLRVRRQGDGDTQRKRAPCFYCGAGGSALGNPRVPLPRPGGRRPSTASSTLSACEKLADRCFPVGVVQLFQRADAERPGISSVAPACFLKERFESVDFLLEESDGRLADL